MLDALLSLDLGVDSRCGGGCEQSVTQGAYQVQVNIPAAAAGSPPGDFTGESDEAFSCLSGLRLRRPSCVLEAGERERRSNRDERFGSGSF
jgi:hypothetical protein